MPHEYSESKISIAPVPESMPVADLGWRRRWHFEVQNPPPTFRLPPPLGGASELSALVTGWWEKRDLFVVEVFTTTDTVEPGELVYLSLVGQWLSIMTEGSAIKVEGHLNHAILSLTLISAYNAQLLRRLGYDTRG